MIRKSLKKYALRFPVIILVFLLVLSGCRDGGPPNEVRTIEEVAGKNIGALYGSPSVRLADELGTSLALYTGDELISSLKAGMIDCVIMESTAAEALVARSKGVRILGEPLIEYDMSFAVAKENAELLKAVNSALVALHDNGTLSGLRDKYFSRGSYVYVPPENTTRRPGSLTLALPPDSPPYSIMDGNGDFTGMDVDVSRAVCDYLGVDLRIIDFDESQLAVAVWFGKADLALGWLPSEGEELVNISEPYAHAVHVVIVRK